jgi:hypothetical protein
MSGKGVTIYQIPALKTLLETPWMALAGVATRQDARMLLKNVHGLSTLQWDNDCPSCFQYEFDGPLPAIGTFFFVATILRENIHRFTRLRRFRRHYWRGNQEGDPD